MLIGREELCRLIPHAGSMCLLDAVEAWDDESIVCLTTSHRDADNPLRADGHLAAVHGAEYGAQAMAVHGGLLARREGTVMSGGYLAALRDVRWNVQYLEAIDAPLHVAARQLLRAGGNMMYEFELSAEGRLLVSGRATVMSAVENEK